MAGYDHQARVRAALESAFPDGLNSRQIMAIVGFSKLVRLRCRSNSALYNALDSIFGGFFKARFKKAPAVNRKGEHYEALVCITPESGMAQEEADE